MLTALLKFSFAGGIIYWLATSGKLDMSLIEKSINSGPNIFIAIGLLAISVLITCYRWKLLLEARAKEKIKYWTLLPIHWIGLFFSTFLPGMVTGDVVKLLYVKDLDSSLSKTFLVTSVLVDRIIGLCGLLTLSGIISIVKYNELVLLSDKLVPLITFNLILSLGSICFMVGIYLPKVYQDKILGLIEKLPLIGTKLAHLFNQIWVFGQFKSLIIKCLGISLLTQSLGMTSIWLISSPFFTTPVELSHLFALLPIGLVTISVPISPSGAGVGHFIFDELFSIVGISGGASFFNIYFLALLSVNLLGAIPYLLLGKKHKLKEAEELETQVIEDL